MSQNPMKLDQQVPRHIWESHGRGFWMLSTYNMESSKPKLALLVLKEKNEAKTLTKPENCPTASPCSVIGPNRPTPNLCVMILDASNHLWMILAGGAIEGVSIAGNFCGFSGLKQY